MLTFTLLTKRTNNHFCAASLMLLKLFCSHKSFHINRDLSWNLFILLLLRFSTWEFQKQLMVWGHCGKFQTIKSSPIYVASQYDLLLFILMFRLELCLSLYELFFKPSILMQINIISRISPLVCSLKIKRRHNVYRKWSPTWP
ncbi:hypothetical protein EGW08_016998 [Elysia chlorotica]|uniref:Uncharacterized protein n=1 Tax=Elysia chlorotica TaxID=188477 RepID=A0A433T107_ELYCH|nr:hypothetical protein EGW08_016998 [Elysia chlorotica]